MHRRFFLLGLKAGYSGIDSIEYPRLDRLIDYPWDHLLSIGSEQWLKLIIKNSYWVIKVAIGRIGYYMPIMNKEIQVLQNMIRFLLDLQLIIYTIKALNTRFENALSSTVKPG